MKPGVAGWMFWMPLVGVVSALMLSTFAVEIIAHRGASYDAPENTLAAFNLGFKQGTDAIELDIHLTADGNVAVLHDYDLKRTGGVPLKVSESTLSELQKHNVGAWGAWKERELDERIPTLAGVLKEVPGGKRVVIEIKCHEEVLTALAETFAGTKLKPDQLPIITFHYEVAQAAKVKFPKHEVFWLHSWSKDKPNPTVEELIQKARMAGLDGLNLNYGFPIDKEFVARVHAARLKLYTWTVNDLPVARRLRDAGVDGITTDRPAWLREELSK